MVIDGFTLFGSWPGLPYDHQVEELVSGIERFRLDRACTLSSKGIFFDATAGNETTWQVCEQHANLIPIGVADPRIDGEGQVAYCQEHQFPLMALFPVTQEWSLHSLPARSVLARIAEAKLPVLIEAEHNGDASAILEVTQGLDMPIILLDVSLRTLTESVAVLKARPNTYLSSRLLCGGDTIEYLAQTVGSDRIIFSSRFPISCFSSAYLTAKFASITEDDQRAIMGGTLAKVLGIG